MTTTPLTAPQVALLKAVADGKVENLGGAFFDTTSGRPRRVTERLLRLERAGLVDRYGVEIKYGRPMRPDERFADFHQATLTPAGQQALDDAEARR